LGPVGTTGYTVAVASAAVSKKFHPWLRLEAQEGIGYIYALKFHNANPELWKTMIIGTGLAEAHLGRHALSPVDEKIVGYKQLITNLVVTAQLVTFDPDIKTVDDLVGKRVAMGFMSQIVWGVAPTKHLEAAGIIDKIDISRVGTMPTIHALIDGLVDVGMVSFAVNPLTGEAKPGATLIELWGTGRKLYYISFGEEAIDNLAAEGYPIVPFTMKAGSMTDVDEDVLLSPNVFTWGAKEVFPEELAYEITKLYLDFYEEFWPYHPLCEFFTPEWFAWGLNKKIVHPGSLRAFEEAGVTVAD